MAENQKRDENDQYGDQKETVIYAGQCLKKKENGKEDGMLDFFFLEVPEKIIEAEDKKPRAQQLQLRNVVEVIGTERENNSGNDSCAEISRQITDESEHGIGGQNIGKKKKNVINQEWIIGDQRQR